MFLYADQIMDLGYELTEDVGLDFSEYFIFIVCHFLYLWNEATEIFQKANIIDFPQIRIIVIFFFFARLVHLVTM